jgi:glycosyltransferase involved in cell wall biosynthesis
MGKKFHSMNASATAPPADARRRVLFVDHAMALGGAEISLLMLLEGLYDAQWEPHLACSGGPLAERAMAQGIPVHLAPLPRLRRSWRAPLDLAVGARALGRTLRAIGADVLVAFSVRAALYAAPAAALTGTPYIWYRNDLWLGGSAPRHRRIERLGKLPLCALAARVVANSRATAQEQPCKAKLRIVYNGIRVQRFGPGLDGRAFREAHGIPLDAPVLGIVGRLNPVKGQDRFLRVLARVLDAIPQAWGLVVGGAIFGEDAYADRLLALAQELGLAERVTFTGQVEDPTAALAATDLFVQPCDPEALGLVNLEAMAMGKTLVGYSQGSLPEIVVDGETGRLTPPGDEEALAQAAIEVLRDPALRAAWGRAGRVRAEACFDVDRMARQVSEVLWEVV